MAAIGFFRKVLKQLAADGVAQTSCILQEPAGSAARLNKVTLENIPQDTVVFFPDKLTQVKDRNGRQVCVCFSPALSESAGLHHNCACDAVILRNTNGLKCSVTYIDMKSGGGGAAKQFQSTKCFIRYLVAIASELHNTKVEIEREKFVVLMLPPRINKQRTRPLRKPTSETHPLKRYLSNNSRLDISTI